MSCRIYNWINRFNGVEPLNILTTILSGSNGFKYLILEEATRDIFQDYHIAYVVEAFYNKQVTEFSANLN